MRKKSILIWILLISFILTGGAWAKKKKKLDLEKVTDPGALMTLGKDMINQKRYEDALACFDKVLQSQPKSLEANFLRGVSLYWLGKFTDANKVFDRCLKMDENNYLIWFYKAKTMNSLKSRNIAIGCLERSLELKPDYPEAWFLKGLILHASKSYRASNSSMLRVIRLNPSDGRAWVFAGMNYYHLADFNNARKYISRGLTIDESLKSNIPNQIMEDLSREQDQ